MKWWGRYKREFPIKKRLIELTSLFLAVIAILPSFKAQTVYAVDETTIVQAKILHLFPDTPEMQMIARCESNFDQSAVNTKTHDYGVLQIHSSWIPLAESFGMDVVNNVDDNLLFGRYLLNKFGLSPWKASESCWNKG